MFRLFVFENKIMSVEYFMDKMRDDEIEDIIENIGYSDRSIKELLRLNAIHTAQKFCKKQLKLTDICEFVWDREHAELSKSDIKNKEEQSKYMLSFLNGTTDERVDVEGQ